MRLLFAAGLVVTILLAASPAQGQGAPSGIVGRWQSPDSEVNINADGTLTIDGTPFRYAIAGKVFTLIGADGSLPMPFELTADRLTVVMNGETIVLQRRAAGTSGTPGAGGATGGQELVGKWCYVSSMTAVSGGGRMSDECFTVHANGTYQYYAETSSSGPNGSAVSQQSDGGTWSLNDSSLIVNSRSQGRSVYTLTKRNHPRTNDPMVCLDGRCFVTYGPKPPWR
jgi:hypothetical protein